MSTLFRTFLFGRKFRILLSRMSGSLSPRESGQLIAETSKDVSIHTEGIQKCAKYVYDEVKRTGYGVGSWLENELHPQTMDKAAIEWVFVADTLNFCFWTPPSCSKFLIDYQGKQRTGYWALCAALNRALGNGIPITDPAYYSTMTKEQLASVFRSDTGVEISLLDERLQALHGVGKILLQKYNGEFANCVKQCQGSAKELLDLIIKDFPHFRDEAQYCGKQVSLYKRAQILIADVWGCCAGEVPGKFRDIGTLTMFADYRVPQVLVSFGAMKYSDNLMEILRKDTLMTNGDRVEVEIRGCSIWAVELVCKEMEKLQKSDSDKHTFDIYPIIVDEFLWDYRRLNADMLETIPYHKVRCIYY